MSSLKKKNNHSENSLKGKCRISCCNCGRDKGWSIDSNTKRLCLGCKYETVIKTDTIVRKNKKRCKL